MESPRAPASPAAPGRRVWVVEDDEPIARCLELMLQECGYTVCTAGSLGAARELPAVPDIVLLDYLLPDGNGVSFLPELHGRHPGVPVILLTALDRVGESRFPSHVRFLAKPFRNRDLLDLIADRLTVAAS